jgi:hypothetical protein
MKTYKANWEVQGLRDVKVLAPGAIVKLDPEEAATLVACGSLSQCDGDTNADLLSMSKAQLVEYAQEQMGLTLDTNKKKDDLLAAIAEAVK